MVCPACGAQNRAGRKFCGECGGALALGCPSCGTPNEPSERFCGECGASLEAFPPSVAPRPALSPSQEPPASERRLVSVLFADLVGFTSLSESRDAEEVRELLSCYFDTARQVIARYGGTVEKFIGDAVMAVWGTPVAQEDDAELAVRAALELVAVVAALGEDVGAPELKLRAGVMTGETAVTLGAAGEGMVAGDLVNTASRVQAAARPGTVLVGDGTRRASEAAIAFEEAGEFELKGKAEPVTLWRATRVVAARRGEGRALDLEAPFVGREPELRLVKELFHATADEGKARLVSVVGVGGIGKSRLAWEFFKYIDGLADEVWWHQGRCLAYGEGVAHWALAEMVRMRARIAEEEAPESALPKLAAAVEEQIADPEERAWVEPRLAHLLGLAERTAAGREDLFPAWRLFFERMAETQPTVLLFEDVQWADASLLDFVEYLLEWSRNHPLFVVTLARPELGERRPSWGAGKRNFHSVFLEPLSPEAIDELLRGLVPGAPAELGPRIGERAEGVPLYAVETVRMLLDRGVLVREDGEYRLSGTLESLEVPETLHALIAARLDGLDPEEHRLLEDAAVLGRTFTKRALAAVAGLDEVALEPLLASLVRKEILTVQADPRSPERGQYGFLQALVQKVAYDTLARRERKAKHLRVADYLESEWGADDAEVVEVVSAHLLEAYRCAPDADDAAEVKARARERLTVAGRRAASLAASEDARRYFEQAVELADNPLEQARLLEQAGDMAWVAGSGGTATEYFERSIALFEAEAQVQAAARVSAGLAEVTWAEGHIDRALERMERSLEVLSAGPPDEDLATLAAETGRLFFFMGKPDLALQRVELALDVAERLWLPEVVSQALNTKALGLSYTRGRPEEAFALLTKALEVALDADRPKAALRAYYNLSNTLYYRDRYERSIVHANDGLALARRIGDRNWEWSFLAQIVALLFVTGEWDAALERAAEIPLEDFAARFAALELLVVLPLLHIARGDVEAAAQVIAVFEVFGDSADVQERAAYEAARAALDRARADCAGALVWGRRALEARESLVATHAVVKVGLVEALESALGLGDAAAASELLAVVDGLGVGESSPYLRAQRRRLGGRTADVDEAGAELAAAASEFAELGMPFWQAVTLLEQGELLVQAGRHEEAARLLAEAEGVFGRLRARPWLERAARAAAIGVAAEATAS